jgi:hypothetical protein
MDGFMRILILRKLSPLEAILQKNMYSNCPCFDRDFESMSLPVLCLELTNAEHGGVDQTRAWTKNSRLTALLIR